MNHSITWVRCMACTTSFPNYFFKPQTGYYTGGPERNCIQRGHDTNRTDKSPYVFETFAHMVGHTTPFFCLTNAQNISIKQPSGKAGQLQSRLCTSQDGPVFQVGTCKNTHQGLNDFCRQSSSFSHSRTGHVCPTVKPPGFRNQPCMRTETFTSAIEYTDRLVHQHVNIMHILVIGFALPFIVHLSLHFRNPLL